MTKFKAKFTFETSYGDYRIRFPKKWTDKKVEMWTKRFLRGEITELSREMWIEPLNNRKEEMQAAKGK